MILPHIIRSEEQVFSHKDNNGKEYSVAVDRLRYKLKKQERVPVAVEQELALRFVNFSGIESERLKNLIELDDATFDSLLPPLILWFKGEEWVLADGNHQYVAAFMRNRKVINCVVAQRQQWAPFIVKDYTQFRKDVYGSFSGIVPRKFA